jgi:hypothetical protein
VLRKTSDVNSFSKECGIEWLSFPLYGDRSKLVFWYLDMPLRTRLDVRQVGNWSSLSVISTFSWLSS